MRTPKEFWKDNTGPGHLREIGGSGDPAPSQFLHTRQDLDGSPQQCKWIHDRKPCKNSQESGNEYCKKHIRKAVITRWDKK